MAWITGRIDKAITENDDELAADLRRFVRHRDAQLRYPFNSLQCNDATWIKALDHLLYEADVIVMDLSGLKVQNRGCAYEIGRLVNEFPERFLLLVDGNTDFEFLRTLLAEVSERRGDGRSKLQLIHMGSHRASPWRVGLSMAAASVHTNRRRPSGGIAFGLGALQARTTEPGSRALGPTRVLALTRGPDLMVLAHRTPSLMGSRA